MRLKHTIIVAGVAAIALAAAGTAFAAKAPSYATQISIKSAAVGPRLSAIGQVSSSRRECVVGREVKIIAVTTSGDKVVDADRASRNGYFGGEGKSSNVIGVKVKATRKVFGPRGHRRVCKPASDEFNLPI